MGRLWWAVSDDESRSLGYGYLTKPDLYAAFKPREVKKYTSGVFDEVTSSIIHLIYSLPRRAA